MIKILNRLKWMAGLVLLQVLVLNQMHIGGYGTPFFYIWFILKIDSRMSRNMLMLWAFGLGLAVDIFGNTPGMNAAVATSLAFFRTPMLRLVTLRDLDEGFRPGVSTMGFSSFFRYALLASLWMCTWLWLIDMFSFAHWPELLLKILTGTVSTLLCVVCAELMWRTDK